MICATTCISSCNYCYMQCTYKHSYKTVPPDTALFLGTERMELGCEHSYSLLQSTDSSAVHIAMIAAGARFWSVSYKPIKGLHILDLLLTNCCDITSMVLLRRIFFSQLLTSASQTLLSENRRTPVAYQKRLLGGRNMLIKLYSIHRKTRIEFRKISNPLWNLTRGASLWSWKPQLDH